jgi:cell division protein FtsQ
MTRMARPRTPLRLAVPGPLPADVRLMNAVASLVFALIVLGLLAAALQWLTRAPVFAIRAIQLDGELARNNVATIRANAAPRLAGNFFSVDLQAARAAFEAVPWVRHAVVRRIWPDRLAVTLEEHRPAALWLGDEGNDRLVNEQGEVFDANVGDVEDEALPSFAGPDGSAAAMLAMYRQIAPLLQRQPFDIERLHLSGRGSWRVDVDNGAVIELGRGSVEEVAARTERFVRTLPQVTGRFRQPLLAADLRHTDGYAVRLRDVTTTEPQAFGKRAN